jgi:hypothetical protein
MRAGTPRTEPFLRDLLLVATVLGLVPFILRRPHVGVLTYAWLSYMNPHRLTWGFAHDLPFAQAVIAMILAGLALTFLRERPLPAMGGAAWLLLALTAWVTPSPPNSPRCRTRPGRSGTRS